MPCVETGSKGPDKGHIRERFLWKKKGCRRKRIQKMEMECPLFLQGIRKEPRKIIEQHLIVRTVQLGAVQ